MSLPPHLRAVPPLLEAWRRLLRACWGVLGRRELKGLFVDPCRAQSPFSSSMAMPFGPLLGGSAFSAFEPCQRATVSATAAHALRMRYGNTDSSRLRLLACVGRWTARALTRVGLAFSAFEPRALPGHGALVRLPPTGLTLRADASGVVPQRRLLCGCPAATKP